MTWANSPEGAKAIACGYKFVEPPSKSKSTQEESIDLEIKESLKDPEFIESHLNQLGKDCSTSISIPLTNPIIISHLQAEDKLTLRALADTGADINVISSRIAVDLIERGIGVRGIAKYRIIDAFLKTRLFYEHVTFNFILDDLSGNETNRTFQIQAVIIDIPLLSDVIIGLPTIRKIKMFRLLPELVEDNDSEDESENEGDSERETRNYPPKSIVDFKPKHTDNKIMAMTRESGSWDEREEHNIPLRTIANFKLVEFEIKDENEEDSVNDVAKKPDVTPSKIHQIVARLKGSGSRGRPIVPVSPSGTIELSL